MLKVYQIKYNNIIIIFAWGGRHISMYEHDKLHENIKQSNCLSNRLNSIDLGTFRSTFTYIILFDSPSWPSSW